MGNFFFQNMRNGFVKRIISFQVITLFICYHTAGQNKEQFNYVVGHSSFIFLGTITQMDSSNINANIYGRKAIVRVEEIIDTSSPVLKMKGTEITVIFASKLKHKNGDKQVFYTNAWSYGKTLGVIEVKNNLNAEFTPDLKSQIKQVRDQIDNDSLKAELKRSVIVARCIVKSIDDSLYDSRFKRSEHNPRLRKALFEVKEVLKGKIKKDTLSAYFASSYDILWLIAPKFSENTEAIFLFNKGQLPAFLNITGYTLLDPRDVQSKNQFNKIKNLVKNLY